MSAKEEEKHRAGGRAQRPRWTAACTLPVGLPYSRRLCCFLPPASGAETLTKATGSVCAFPALPRNPLSTTEKATLCRREVNQLTLRRHCQCAQPLHSQRSGTRQGPDAGRPDRGSRATICWLGDLMALVMV